MSPVRPFFTSSIALSKALYAEFDLGDKHNSIVTTDKGILPSGNPIRSTDSIAGKTLAQSSGLANPISSYAITSNLLQMETKSPPSNNLAK
ncbi:Uncharacterised protein [Streptococcus pneumoniae]|nr:Uncharacterised protein [Streptococcus pneumoniae]